MAYLNKENMMFVGQFNITLYCAWNKDKKLCGVIINKFSSMDEPLGQKNFYFDDNVNNVIDFLSNEENIVMVYNLKADCVYKIKKTISIIRV